MDDPQRLQSGFTLFKDVFEAESEASTYAKFGLPGDSEEDEPLMAEAYQLMQQTEVDMTLFFRGLPDVDEGTSVSSLNEIFYDADKLKRDGQAWNDWLKRYGARVARLGAAPEERRERMNAVNPLYVPRNYLLQEAIEMAESGDESRIWELLELFRLPYTEQPGKERFAARRPEWAREKAGCSMLSCSS
jgi:uncharacterized protein YdiU (UPF0061 family)